MPHAVIEGAESCPPLDEPLAREQGVLHKVVEVAETPKGWLLKSLVISEGTEYRFLTRIDRREDGLLVHLDSHVHVERTPPVFDHLALVAQKVLDANPGARIGKTNLADRLERLTH